MGGIGAANKLKQIILYQCGFQPLNLINDFLRLLGNTTNTPGEKKRVCIRKSALIDIQFLLGP